MILVKMPFLMIRQILETGRKLLISMPFGFDPKKLWITLLRTWSGGPESLENQAFAHIAHSVGKLKIPMKSMTCETVCTQHLLLCSKRVLWNAVNGDVHKSSL
jgi:hypothetical protein